MSNITFKKIELGSIGKINLTDRCMDIIDTLHDQVGATEWSGMLFYKIKSGDIKDMKDLELESDFIYPRDIGNATYTETTASGDVAAAYDVYEDGLECSAGLVHTHHNMTTFFSGTDTKELEDNAGNYNYYVSLIVNFSGKYCCKIAIPGKRKMLSTIEMIDTNGQPYLKEFESYDNVLFVGDLDVIHGRQVVVEDWLTAKIQELKQAKQEKIVPFAYRGVQDEFKDFQQTSLWDRMPVREKKPKASAKGFLAALVVDETVYPDTLSALEQEIEANCNTPYIAKNTMDFIEDNIYEVYANMFDEDTAMVEKNLRDTLKELEVFKPKFGRTKFYNDLSKLLTEEIKSITE